MPDATPTQEQGTARTDIESRSRPATSEQLETRAGGPATVPAKRSSETDGISHDPPQPRRTGAELDPLDGEPDAEV